MGVSWREKGMRLLSRLTAWWRGGPKSKIRQWAERRERDMRHSDTLDLEALFAAMMYCLTSFPGREYDKRRPSDWVSELHRDVYRKYSGDASLFEVGCYLYIRTDLWLFDNRREYRDEISSFLARRFCRLLTDALRTNSVPPLFDQRIEMYAELVRKGELERASSFYLPQLVLRTAENALPKAYRFGSEPVLIVGIDEAFFLNVGIVAFEQAMVPAFLESLGDFIAHVGT